MITGKFRRHWKCAVRVLRDGGQDKYGNNLPEVKHVVADCLVAPSSTKDLQDFSERPRTGATLYGPVAMDVRPSDRVVVPAPHPMAAVYKVGGDPGFWPMGTTVPLDRVRDLTAAERSEVS